MLKQVCSVAFLVISVTASADPIYVQPGQCIFVGSQQVCAMEAGSAPKEIQRRLHVCRYGHYKDSEVPELKSHALIEIMVTNEGKKIETAIKNFGSNGKAACEKELAQITD